MRGIQKGKERNAKGSATPLERQASRLISGHMLKVAEMEEILIETKWLSDLERGRAAMRQRQIFETRWAGSAMEWVTSVWKNTWMSGVEEEGGGKMKFEESHLMEEIADLLETVDCLLKRVDCERSAFIQEKQNEGWQLFVFFSSYQGSHEEMGEADERKTYLFHPDIELSGWNEVKFHHGHWGCSQHNSQFEAWLQALSDDQYIAF